MMRALWPIALSKGQRVAVEWEDGERTGQVEEVCASMSDAFPCAAVLSPLLRSAAPRSRLSSFRMAWCHAGAHSVDH